MATPSVIMNEVGKLICNIFTDGEDEESSRNAETYMANTVF
jgi:hypothetical protein